MTPNPISSLQLFHDLPASSLAQVNAYASLFEYKDGDILFNEGQPVEHIHIILHGTVEIYKSLAPGHEQHIAFRNQGDTIGEINLFDAQGVRSASVRAVSPVQIVQINLGDMESLISKNPQIAHRLFAIISQRLRDSESHLVQDLRSRNQALHQALIDLQAAQDQLVAQEKLEHELAMARTIQQNLLPKTTPSIPGWQINAVWEPAHAVSGDFYDFIAFPDGKLGLIVGDVTGKGVPAALVMATTHSVLRAVTGSIEKTYPDSPGEILTRVNNILCQDMPKFMFVTCLLMIVNPQDGSLTVANAGHVLPIHITSQDIHEIRAIGLPLGLIPDQNYDSVSSQLKPGESLFFLSDGLVEAHDPHGEMYGSNRLIEQLTLCCDTPAFDGQKLINQLLQELHAFTGEGWEQEDDLTFVTLARF